MSKVIIIAEAGVNHNGSISMACDLVDAAAAAGVDYVKFQSFRAGDLVCGDAKKADYQSANTGDSQETQYSMLKKLELSDNDHMILMKRAVENGIGFMSTAFDPGSIEYLNSLDLPFWKIPSGEITNFPYLRALGRTGKPVILSTGMADLYEIGEAIDVLVKYGTPRNAITLLHCTTEYPAPKDEVNLCAMLSMRKYFGMPVGYSDHTEGIEIPIAAAALGAVVIEKHFTLDRSLPGPDQKASLEPAELLSMVSAIRNVESAMGSGIKEPTLSEIKNMTAARKSIVAGKDIVSGEIFSGENIAVKRPGGGISPMLWESVIGLPAKRDFKMDEQIEL